MIYELNLKNVKKSKKNHFKYLKKKQYGVKVIINLSFNDYIKSRDKNILLFESTVHDLKYYVTS